MSQPSFSVLTGHLETEIVRDVQRIEGISEAWNELFGESPNTTPFLSYALVSLLAHRLEANEELHLILVRDAGRLVGVGPFKSRQLRLGKMLLPVVIGEVAYAGLLVSQDRIDVVQSIATTVGECRDISLLYLPLSSSNDALVWNFAVQCRISRFEHRWWPRDISHSIRNPGGFESYISRKSGKSRQGLAREERKLGALGTLDVQRFAGSDFNESLLSRLAELQRRSWQLERFKIRPIDDPWEKKRHLTMAQAGLAEVFILTVGGTDTAFVLNYMHGGTVYAMLTAFVESEGAGSPGKYLWKSVIRELLDRGDRRYELVIGDADYKRFWCNQTHHVIRSVSYRGFRGWCMSWIPYRADAFFSSHPKLKERVRACLAALGFRFERRLLN